LLDWFLKALAVVVAIIVVIAIYWDRVD